MDKQSIEDAIAIASKQAELPEIPRLASINQLPQQQELERYFEELASVIKGWRKNAVVAKRQIWNCVRKGKRSWGRESTEELTDPDLILVGRCKEIEMALISHRNELERLLATIDESTYESEPPKNLRKLIFKADTQIIHWFHGVQELRWTIRIADGLKTKPSGKTFDNAKDFIDDLNQEA